MKTIKAIFISLFILLIGSSVFAEEEEYPPYYKVATVKGSMSEVAASVRDALESNDFKVIGEYHVAAMPYEIILQDTEVTMLPGRYRIALH